MENRVEDCEAKLPKYRVDVFSTSLEGENTEFITLHVRLRGKLLHIEISPTHFLNSPSLTAEFYKYLEVAKSGLDALNDDLMYDLFDWATKPFLPLFKVQESMSSNMIKEAVTLQDFLYPQTFDCEFTAVDDKCIPRRIQRQEIQEVQEPPEFGDEFLHLKAQLQTIHPAKVELRPENPDEASDLPDAQPHSVCVNSQMLFFKSTDMTSLQDTTNAIQKYLRIASLGSDIRASQLHGIVADDQNPLIGLLFRYIDAEDTLSFIIEPNTPGVLKHQWSTQITDTLTRLHQGGVVWGDVKPDNVLIDRSNDAWIIDFEGGYTEGWVDREKAGTVEGELQGLANLVAFIFEEKAVCQYSDDDEYDKE